MSQLWEELEQLGVLDASRLTTYHPRVRDREDVAVMRDSVTDVIVLSRTDQIDASYYPERPELPGTLVHGARVVSPTLADDIRRTADFGSRIRGRRWLDFGCGLGGMLDQLAGEAAWAAGLEPSNERASIARARGHRIVGRLDEVRTEQLQVVTLFHVLEHLTAPLASLRDLREAMAPGATLLVEVPHARDALFALYDCEAFKRFTFWSEHLVLHTRQSLQTLLLAAGFTGVEVRGFQRYPLANHLHWLARGKPGGQNVWDFLTEPVLDQAYSGALARVDRTDSLVATATVS